MNRSLALLFVAALLPASAPAQSYDSTLFAGLEWRNIGPNRGGRSIASAGSPSRPNEYYFGAVGGGLWKTTDGGLSWQPVTDGKIRSSSVGAIGVSESNPDVIYIGMGETEFRGNIMQGDGVYKSTDAGKTWTHVGLENTQAISRVRVDRKNSDIVYVAALGHPYAPNSDRGVFRSRDGGKSWTKVLFRNDSTGAVDLSLDPNDPNTIYAALWQVYRTPWSMWDGGAGSGLFKSTDGGDHWTEITRNPGMPGGIIGKIGVSVSGADSKRVYAIVENDSGGVFRSDDGGATWKRTNVERKLRQRAFYYSRIYADPKFRDRVYVLNTGFYRSDDAAVKFDTVLNPPHGDQHDLWISPNDNQRMINSNDGGGNVSTNGGKSWTSQRYPTAQAYHVAVTSDFPYHVCGAQQDNSTFCEPSSDWSHIRGPNQGNGDFFYYVGGGESGYIAPNPGNPDIIYAGSQGALLTRYNRRTGEIRDVQVYPRFFSGEPASALPERWQWTYPIVFSPLNSRVLYTSSQHLWKTTNEGQTWTRISPDLTRADPNTLGLSGGPITHDMNGPEIYGTIFTVAPSRHDTATIWTGSDDGLAYITRNGGKTWTNVTPKDLPPFSRISLIDASPNDPGGAYLAAKRYQLDDRAPYIYRTHDYGRTWTKIVNGIRADDYIHAVREDPKRRGLLYAGAEHGVYVSFDDGSTWRSLSLKLPDTQVSDLVVAGNDLVIATHGRSMYVLENITPLRELTPVIASSRVHLYKPRDAVRGVVSPSFQYYLKSKADTVKIEILDAAGKVIRTFIGADTAKKKTAGDSVKPDSLKVPTPAVVDSCTARVRKPPRPSTAAGLNKFTWDALYPGATVFECMIIWGGDPASGPPAPPGRYAVRLTANGETQTQPFILKRDPRETDVSDADLRAQFELASKVSRRVSDANEAVTRIRALKAQLRERLAAGNASAEYRAAAPAVIAKLQAVEEDLYQVRNRSGQDPLNFPIKINDRLSALENSIETGDAKPTDAAYRVFAELSADLDRMLGTLKAIEGMDLKRINEVLRASGAAPIV